VDYKLSGSGDVTPIRFGQISFAARTKAHDLKQCRVGRIAVKQRQAHGLEVELIVIVDGKARSLKPSEAKLRTEDREATELTEPERKTVTDKADAWVRAHHLEAAARKQKQAEIAALDLMSLGRLRPTIVKTDSHTNADRDKDTEKEAKERERERQREKNEREKRKGKGKEKDEVQ